jgi:serine protease
MSDVFNRRMRLHALAVATAAVISAVSLSASAAGHADTRALKPAGQYDRFIVKFREGSVQRADAATLQTTLQQAARAVPAKGRALGVDRLRRLAVGAEVIRTDRKLDSAEAESLMRQLAADPNVEYVEVDKLNKPLLTPNDPDFGQQYGFGTGAGGTRATEAWDSATGAGVVVAVLDTGITSHSDLSANVLGGYDFIADTTVAADGDGRDGDASDPGDAYGGFPSSWHGTHVAGTIAAVTNNGQGVAGMAFDAKVVPVRVLGKGGGYDSDIADAMVWAAGGSVSGAPANPNPAEVINLSLGGSGACSSTTQSAIDSAVGNGATIVIAAGNSNADVSGFSPGNCANIVSVASTDSAGARSSFSNYGSLIDVAAPGSDILSTLNSGTDGPGAESYASYSGTSMAAPHVAGVVALMQSVAASPLSPADAEATLKSSARAFPSTPSQPIGSGIVDAKAAVDAAGGGGGEPPGGGQTYNSSGPVAIADNATVESPIAVSGRGGNAPSNATVAVNISHTYRGDLLVELVAPNGSTYALSDRSGGSADDVVGSFTVDLSSEALDGTWILRVNDNAAQDIGTLNSWSITF